MKAAVFFFFFSFSQMNANYIPPSFTRVHLQIKEDKIELKNETLGLKKKKNSLL